MEGRLPRVLIVDESRIVRAMLIRHIRDYYDFREEADGEAAWQVLVLDQSIEVVVCSLSMPVLDGDGLLQRVRSSRLARLSRMPMLMIYGDNDEALERAKGHGASDFISRASGATELLARIDSLRKLAQAQNEIVESREQHVQNPETGLFTRKYVELQAMQAMSHALRHGGEVSAMVMGFDSAGVLRDEHGVDAVKQLQQRFTAILSSKVRKEDSLGHYAGSQLVVVSPGTPYSACQAFGNRLRSAIEVANIAVHGQRLQLSVSIGISNSPADNVASAGALIDLAGERLKIAQEAGGNRVVAGNIAAAPTPSIERALALIKAGRAQDLQAHLPALGRQLLPLLGLIDSELKLGMALAELEQALAARALPADAGESASEGQARKSS